MRSIPFVLAPHADITGDGPRWHAASGEPWFELRPEQPLAGRWLSFRWSAGLLEPVSRPVIRCELAEGEHDIFPPGAPFGRGEFVAFIPAETRRILISPVGRPGPFGFRLDALEALSPVKVQRMGARFAPGTALFALSAHAVGFRPGGRSLTRDALGQQPFSRYPRWRRRGSRPFEPEGIDGPPSAEAERLHIRIIMPGEGVPSLPALVEDLRDQPHARWSLLIIGREATRLPRQAAALPIRAVAPPDASAEIAAGLSPEDLVLELPAGTRLEPLALTIAAEAAARDPEAELIYADEDRLAPEGRRAEPRFKPGFDARLIGQVNVAGWAGFRRARTLAGVAIAAAPPFLPAPRMARGVSLARVLVSLPADAPSPPAPPPRPIRRAAPPPEATIIIPTRDRLKLLKPCIDSVLARTQGAIRLIVVDNGSREQATRDYLAALAADSRIRVLAIPGPFNFSKLCNAAAALAETDLLVFLNNDTVVISPDWLDILAALAREPDVGAVGAKLLFPSGKVQHGGVIVGMGGRAGHFQHSIAPDDPGYFGRANHHHTLSAVTGACLAVERAKFEAIGGFDAERLPVELNDIDLCLRLGERGWNSVFAADCLLTHHESASRGRPWDNDRAHPGERAWFCRRWLSAIRGDPHFSPSLSLYAWKPSLG